MALEAHSYAQETARIVRGCRTMKQVALTFPELGLIAGTRAALGAGLALLLGDRLSPEQRRAVGWTLLAVGIITTVPLGVEVFKGSQTTSGPNDSAAV